MDFYTLSNASYREAIVLIGSLNKDLAYLDPGSGSFILQILLGLDGGFECVTRSKEGSTKGIANDLKDIAMVGFNRFAQYGMMPRPRHFPRFRMLARQSGAIFDVCEEKSNCTGRVGGQIASL